MLEQKILLNNCFGGFGLSVEAAKRVEKVTDYRFEYEYGAWCSKQNEIQFRTHPEIIKIVEEMGKKASGDCSKIIVSKVFVNIEIDSYDGQENCNVFGYSD